MLKNHFKHLLGISFGVLFSMNAYASDSAPPQPLYNNLILDTLSEGPSFCSSATYFVFLKTLESLETKHKIAIGSDAARKLLPIDESGRGLDDGFGVWGRWNANGPGTAGLFADLDLGYNFSDDSFRHAQAGDFMKIFWKWGHGVGKKERGHSVVYLGVEPKGATGRKIKKVCFWSSNTHTDDSSKNGFSEKCVDRSDIKEIIFSRLTHPENIVGAKQSSFSFENSYLSSLLKVESTIEEARKMTRTNLFK